MADIKLSKRMQAVADMVTAGCVTEKSGGESVFAVTGNIREMSGCDLLTAGERGGYEKAGASRVRCVADIGCDHAFVSIYLRIKGIAANVIAMDVRKGPLDIARANIASYGLDDYIDVRLSDGLEALEPGEADTAIIAGMGGLLMVDILKRGSIHTDAGIELVLQPQSEPDKLRQYLYKIGYEIADESFLQEEGKYYTVMRALKKAAGTDGMTREDEAGAVASVMTGFGTDDAGVALVEDMDGVKKQAEMLYGPVLLKKKDELLGKYIKLQLEKNHELRDKLMANQTPKGILRIKELEKEEKIMDCALRMI